MEGNSIRGAPGGPKAAAKTRRAPTTSAVEASSQGRIGIEGRTGMAADCATPSLVWPPNPYYSYGIAHNRAVRCHRPQTKSTQNPMGNVRIDWSVADGCPGSGTSLFPSRRVPLNAPPTSLSRAAERYHRHTDVSTKGAARTEGTTWQSFSADTRRPLNEIRWSNRGPAWNQGRALREPTRDSSRGPSGCPDRAATPLRITTYPRLFARPDRMLRMSPSRTT